MTERSKIIKAYEKQSELLESYELYYISVLKIKIYILLQHQIYSEI